MTPEGQTKRDIDIFLKSLGPDCWWFKPMNMGYGRKGIPDYVGCYRGRFFSIEAKRLKGGILTPWQKKENTAVETAGGIAIIASDVGMVKQAFMKYLGYVVQPSA